MKNKGSKSPIGLSVKGKKTRKWMWETESQVTSFRIESWDDQHTSTLESSVKKIIYLPPQSNKERQDQKIVVANKWSLTTLNSLIKGGTILPVIVDRVGNLERECTFVDLG